jgi:CBS domain containing-hemolysin-like protein
VATSPYSRLPVYRGSLDRVIGILHTKDVVLDSIGDHPRASLAALLRPIMRVRETMPADRLLAFLRERRSHHALVEDDGGRISGLITLEDVVGELLGGVPDEFKVAQLRAILLTDGRVRLPGAMRLDQAAPVLGAWRGSNETVAAHIARTLGRVPQQGERVTVDGLEIEIEVVEAGTIASVIVGSPDPRPEQDR